MLKTGFRNLQLAIRLKQANFENPTHNFDALVFPTPSSHLLTFTASHDLKETIDKASCECGMPLETIRESEAPLKERSERV